MDNSLAFILSSSKRSMELRDGCPQRPEDDDVSTSSHLLPPFRALLLTPPFMACDKSPSRLQNSLSNSCTGTRYLELLSWNGRCMLDVGASDDTAAAGGTANWC